MPEKNEGAAQAPQDSEKGAPVVIGAPITLKHPYKVHSVEFAQVNFTRRPKAKDTIEAHNLAQTDAERELVLIAKVLGMKPDELQEMDLADYNTVLREFQKAFLS